jgi:hypothetical protein
MIALVDRLLANIAEGEGGAQRTSQAKLSVAVFALFKRVARHACILGTGS